MIKKIFVRLSLGILVIVLFCVWYIVAANYDYSALAGTYVFHSKGETCTLYLHPDRTFVQEISRSGEIEKSHGYWLRYGEAHVSFSSEFLKLSGEEMDSARQAHGQFAKTLGLFPTLTLAPEATGPRFHKKFFI